MKIRGRNSLLSDEFGDARIGTIIGTIVLGIALVVAIAIAIGYPISLSQSRESCRHWGQDNARQTKFVQYTFWSWDCLTPNLKEPGTWISTSNPVLVGN